MEKEIVKLSIFLMKDDIERFEDCLKDVNDLVKVEVKKNIGISGQIFFCKSVEKTPIWKKYIEYLVGERVEIGKNTSNKAVAIVKVKKNLWLLFLDMVELF